MVAGLTITHPTQGEDLKDFGDNLRDIYAMIRNGTLEPVRRGIPRLSA